MYRIRILDLKAQFFFGLAGQNVDRTAYKEQRRLNMN